MNLKTIFLGCVALAFISCWHYGEKTTERWNKRLSHLQQSSATPEASYKNNELNELAWYGDEGAAVGKKIGFYDNLADGTTQWMENRDRASVYYFLRPSQIWLNDWKAFEEEAELIYLTTDDIIPFTKELKKRKMDKVFTKKERPGAFTLFWREGTLDEEKYKLRNKVIYGKTKLSGGDPGTGNYMWFKLLGGIIGWAGMWLGGIWLYRTLSKKYNLTDEGYMVWEGWIGLGLGMLSTILLLFIAGMLGISGNWFSFLLGMSGWILGWRSGIVQESWNSIKRSKATLRWPLLWLLLLGGLLWFMTSKPAGDLAALWSTAVKSRMILEQNGIGHWMYTGGETGWVDMQTHYPPGFPLLGSYLAWWGIGWHERACWLLPALIFASMVGAFIQVLTKSMQIDTRLKRPQWLYFFATMIALSIFSSQWFYWLIELFYADSLLIFFGLCGFGVLYKHDASYSIFDYLLAGVLLASMGWVKNEGTVLYVLIISGFFVFVNKQSWKKCILLFASTGMIIFPWIICLLAYGLSDPFVDLSLLFEKGWSHFIEKSNEAWKWFYKMIATPPAFYSGAWYISLFCLILGLCLCCNIRWRLFILWVISWWFVIHCCIFSASTLAKSSWHLPALPRLWMLPTLLLVIIALSFKKSTSDAPDQKNYLLI